MAHAHDDHHNDHHHAHEEKRLSVTVTTISIVVVALLGISIGYGIGNLDRPRVVDNISAPPLLQTGQRFAYSLPQGDSPSWGSDAAPVTAIVFSDLTCKDCEAFTYRTHDLDALKNAFGPDQLRIVFKHLPSNQEPAVLAHRAAFAASQQGAFWEYADKLSALRNAKNAKPLDRAAVMAVAKSLSLDANRFQRDLDSPVADRAIAADRAVANLLGLGQRPAVVVNGLITDIRRADAAIRTELGTYERFARGQASNLSTYFYAGRLAQNLSPSFDPFLAIASAPAVAAAPSVGAAAPSVGAPAVAAPADARGAVGATGLDFTKLPVKGNPNAKITVLEFSDFECPFCGRVNPTMQQVLSNYPNDVRIAFVQLPLSFHKNAHPAAQASLAAHEQGRFWEYHDILFANQKALTRADLERYAEQLGLDMTKFRQALDSEKFKAEVDAQLAYAESVGISGTPGFLVNGVEISGAVPFDNFKTTIDAEILRADKVAKEKGLSGAALYSELFKSAPKAAPRDAAPAEPTTPVVVDIAGAPLKGNPNAKVTIVEFSDFECPFCSRVNPTIAQLMNDYPDQIKVVFKQLPLPFHKNAPLAAQASLAAHEQGRFWEYHDILFANQKALTRPDLERYAEQLGLDMAKFRQALDSEKFKAQVDKDLAEASKNSVNGTPNFSINGKRLVGAQPVAAFKAIIDAELNK